MNNYIPPENRITLEDIKRWTKAIKSLFNKNNYKNEAFFKTIISVLLIFFIISGISGIYLSYKIFNFVTGNATSLRTEVNQKVTTVGEAFDQATHRLFTVPNDEGEVYREIAEKRFQERRAEQFKTDLDNAKEIVKFMNNASQFSKEEIMNKMHKVPLILTKGFNCMQSLTGVEQKIDEMCTEDKFVDQVKYYSPYQQVKYCYDNIIKWRELYKGHLSVKKAVLEKYKEQLATHRHWDKGEKEATQAYVDKVSKYDFKDSDQNLMRQLKERDLEDLEIKRKELSLLGNVVYSNEIGELKHCQQLMEIILPSMIKYSYDFDQSEIGKNEYWSYKVSYDYMKKVANDLYIEEAKPALLIPTILNEESNSIHNIINHNITNFQSIIEHYKKSKITKDDIKYLYNLSNIVQRDNLEDLSKAINQLQTTVTHNSNHKESLKLYIIGLILERTNKQLATLELSNIGFTCMRYQERMNAYHEWQKIFKEKKLDGLFLRENNSN